MGNLIALIQEAQKCANNDIGFIDTDPFYAHFAHEDVSEAERKTILRELYKRGLISIGVPRRKFVAGYELAQEVARHIRHARTCNEDHNNGAWRTIDPVYHGDTLTDTPWYRNAFAA